MTDTYADTWNTIPRRARDKIGTDETLDGDDIAALVHARVPVALVGWGSNGPQPGDQWMLSERFELFAAERLDEEADRIDGHTVEVAKIPLTERNVADDPRLTEEEIHRAVELRLRARRLRGEE